MTAPHRPPTQHGQRRQVAHERQVAQEAQQRRRRVVMTVIVAALVVIGVVATLLIKASQQPSEATANFSVLSERGGVVVGADGILPPPDGQEAWTQRALADVAAQGPVVVSVYSDYLCPFCAVFEMGNAETLEPMLASGEIIMVYHRVAILDRASGGTQYSTRAAAAALHVAEHDPDAFQEFNDLLMLSQPGEAAASVTDDHLAWLATEAGVAEDVAQEISAGEMSHDQVAWATEVASQDLGRLSTPTILLNGELLDPQQYDWRIPGVLEEAIHNAAN